MLSKAQTALHWRMWKQVRARLIANGFSAEEADAERYVIYREACGKSSIKDLNHRGDFDMVLAHFKAIVDPGDFDAQMHAENGQRDRSVWSIKEAAKTLGESYVAKVAEDRFSVRDWHALDDRRLSQLAMTLSNRIRNRNKVNN